jgi:hypothetical protein
LVAGSAIKTDSMVVNTIGHAIAGGIGAELAGGKFGNGAITGAFGYLFNCVMHAGPCGPGDKQSIQAGHAACGRDIACQKRYHNYAREAGMPVPRFDMETVLDDFVDYASTPARIMNPIGRTADFWIDVKKVGKSLYDRNDDWAGVVGGKGFDLAYSRAIASGPVPASAARLEWAARIGSIVGKWMEPLSLHVYQTGVGTKQTGGGK